MAEPERARVDLMQLSPIFMFLTLLFFGSLYLICFGTTMIPVFSRDCFIFLSCLAEILRFYGIAVFSNAPAKKSQRKHSVTRAILTHALYLLIFIARQFLRFFCTGFDFYHVIMEFCALMTASLMMLVFVTDSGGDMDPAPSAAQLAPFVSQFDMRGLFGSGVWGQIHPHPVQCAAAA
jgi:hypothetical protein